MTGYAKDYIGQLCREGRVPARLIGRSWYVLEAAIQDHRFGAVGSEQKDGDTSALAASEGTVDLQKTWESPRYVVVSEEPLPSVNRLEDMELADSPPGQKDIQHIQDSWKDWFDRFDDIGQSVTEEVVPDAQEDEMIEEEPAKEEESDKIAVQIPIHVERPGSCSLSLPPEELLPLRTVVAPMSAISISDSSTDRIGGNNKIWGMIQVSGALVAAVIAVVAVLGSGYFDAYIISNNQVRAVAGVALYNR